MDKKLFNPLSYDFRYTWYDDDNNPIELVMRSMEITSFTPPQADFMAKHLADAIINERGIKTNHEDEYREILKEINIVL